MDERGSVSLASVLTDRHVAFAWLYPLLVQRRLPTWDHTARTDPHQHAPGSVKAYRWPRLRTAPHWSKHNLPKSLLTPTAAAACHYPSYIPLKTAVGNLLLPYTRASMHGELQTECPSFSRTLKSNNLYVNILRSIKLLWIALPLECVSAFFAKAIS